MTLDRNLERILEDTTWLRALARRLVSDEDLSEDLEQDVRVRALENPPHTSTNLSGWLSAVMRNRFFTHKRRERMRARHEKHVAYEQDREADPVDHDLEALRRVVARAVLELPEIHRDVLLLRYYLDLTSVEIGEILAQDPGTVRVRLRRALAKLRTRLVLEEPELARPRSRASAGAEALPTLHPSTETYPIRVCDCEGKPVPDAQVSFFANQPTNEETSSMCLGLFKWLMLDLPGCKEYGTTDADGNLLVPRHRLQHDVLIIRASGYQTAFEHRELDDGNPYDVTLRPPEVVSVEVLTDDGNPASGVSVGIWSEDGQSTTRSDVNGRTTLAWIDRHYAVRVTEAGFVPTQRLVTAPQTQLRLIRGKELDGRVQDSSGAPVAGCRVTLEFDTWDGPYDCGVTDTTGKFRTPLLPAAGSLRVRFRHPDYVASDRWIDLAEPGALIGVLCQGASIVGTVRGANSGLLRAGRALLVQDTPAEADFVPDHLRSPIAADGSFRLGSVAPGDHHLYIDHPDHCHSPIAVSGVEVGETRSFKIRLDHGLNIPGRVMDTARKGVAGVRLTLGHVLGPFLRGRTVESDRHGHFIVERPLKRRHLLRPVGRDFRWEFPLNELAKTEPVGWNLLVHSPHNLVDHNGRKLVNVTAIGCSGTFVGYDTKRIDLVIDEPTGRAPRLRLQHRGRRVRAPTFVMFTGLDNTTWGTFAGVDGQIKGLRSPQTLAGQSLAILCHGYEWKYIQLSAQTLPELLDDHELVQCQRYVTLVVRDLDGAGILGLDLYVRGTTSESHALIYAGPTDSHGRLVVTRLPRGQYEARAVQLGTLPRRMLGRAMNDPFYIHGVGPGESLGFFEVGEGPPGEIIFQPTDKEQEQAWLSRCTPVIPNPTSS